MLSKSVDGAEWLKICRLYSEKKIEGVRISVCVPCGFIKVYDADGKVYKMPRFPTIGQVEEAIELAKNKTFA